MPSLLDLLLPDALPPVLVQELQQGITTKRVAKGQLLQRKGDRAREHYFVKSGLLRSYTLDEKGKEHIYMFAPEGWLIGDVGTYLLDKEADLFIDALEESEVDVLGNDVLQRLDRHNGELIKKLNKRLYVLQKRVLLLLSASLPARYLDFVATYPNIVQRVPQKMIASYLGVTPEALSKVRGELVKPQ